MLVRTKRVIVFLKEPFKQKTGDKPDRRIVQPDHAGQVPAGMFIVPGTQFSPVEPYAGGKFTGKDQSCVNKTADRQAAVSHKPADGGQEGGHSVYGKHP